MNFSQDFISKVLESNDIVDVIGQDTQLKGRGAQFMGLCPFPNHRERTPSFSVNQDKQVYHCFGCKESGNLFTYLKMIRGMNFPEAVEFLARRASLPLPEDAREAASRMASSDQKQQLGKINELAAMYFHRQLLKLNADHPVRVYLSNRGLSAEMVAQFQIGYAPEGWEGLASTLGENGVDLLQAQSLGLVKQRSQGKSGFFDLFRHRLMFPIVSPAGRYIGFGGRVINPEDQPKYLNSPESEMFHKGKVLYALDQTAKYIRSADQVLVVEGYTDLLALFQAGVKNVVATLGTALTESHCRLMRRYTKNVIVLFDGDEAGQAAAERSLPILLSQGLYPKAILLPEKMDPDEFVKSHGATAFSALMVGARDLFWEILERKTKHTGSEASDKVKTLDQFTPTLKGMSDLRLRDLYIDEIALRWGVSSDWIKRSLHEAGTASTSPRLSSSAPEVVKPLPETVPQVSKFVLKGAPRAELWLLNAALHGKELWEAIKVAHIMDLIMQEGVKSALQRIAELDGQMPSKFDSLTSLLMAEVDLPGDLTLLLDPSLKLTTEGLNKLVQDCVERVRRDYKRRELKKIKEELRNKKGSDSLSDLERIMNIHRSTQSNDVDLS